MIIHFRTRLHLVVQLAVLEFALRLHLVLIKYRDAQIVLKLNNIYSLYLSTDNTLI